MKESAGAAAARGSQRARMAAYANAQLDAGVEITGADLDREFGTKNYGRAVLRDVKEARQPAATAGDEPAVPAQAGVPVGAGVSDG